MEFYNEIHGSPPETPSIKEIKEKGKEKVKEDFTKDVEEDEILAQVIIFYVFSFTFVEDIFFYVKISFSFFKYTILLF